MRIIDMHCDTLLEGWRHQEQSLVDGDFSINLQKLAESESLTQFFAIFLSRRENTDPYDLFKEIYGYYTRVMAENQDKIRPVYCASDIEKNRQAGLLSSLLTIEEGALIDGKMERVQEIYDMGVRLLTLTWNYENCIGYPNNDDPQLHQKGLKPFGIEVVEKMNELGMIVDVSHLSEGGFYDVAKYSKKPFVASHSCARALCNHRRNLTDDQLKTLGEHGGAVGINFEASFLNDDCTPATFDRIITHLLHMKDKAGIEAVAFGSDFDGIEDNGEMVDYRGFTPLLARMEKYFTPAEIDMICWQNVMRVIRDVTGH